MLALFWRSPFTIAPKSGVKRPYFVVRKDKRTHLDSTPVAISSPSPPLEGRGEEARQIGRGQGIGKSDVLSFSSGFLNKNVSNCNAGKNSP